MSKAQGWQGEIRLGDGVALFRGQAGDQAFHRHHAIQICVGRGVQVETAEGQYSGPAVAIPADRRHRLASGLCLLAYVDPECAAGRQLAQALGGQPMILDGAAAARLESVAPAAQAVARAAFPGLAVEAARPGSTVGRVKAAMASSPEEVNWQPRLLARALDLSVDLLGRRFRAESGMQLRSWLKWQRLQQALALALAGEDLTAAAHGAGFADQAHLTRTMRETFGLSPSSLFDRRRTVSFKRA